MNIIFNQIITTVGAGAGTYLTEERFELSVN